MEPSTSPPTIGAWLDQATRQLQACGIDTARMDARMLLGFVTGKSVAQMISDRDGTLTHDAVTTLSKYMQRRLAREPVSRILGEREFYGRPFQITRATLDPRPDSETLIDAVLDLVREEGWSDQPLRICDFGTGTGCLLLTLLAELPHATGLGIDISSDALAVARANAKALSFQPAESDAVGLGSSRLVNHNLERRAEFRVANSLRTVNESFHFLVSNPPYIPHDQVATLDPEVRCFDPLIALDGGGDGLDFYRDLASMISPVVSGGWSLLEVGAGQAGDVNNILDGVGLPSDAGHRRVIRDLAGIERVVAVQVPRGKT